MKFIKNNIKFVFGLILGLVLSGTTVYAAVTSIKAEEASYSNSATSVTNVQDAIDELYTNAVSLNTKITNLKSEVIDEIYPVGSIYISTTDDSVEDVEDRFGGTWEKYAEGRTLVGDDGSTYTSGSTGGSSTTTLTVANLPSHSHTISHTHSTSSKSISISSGLTAASAGGHNHAITAYSSQSSQGTTIPTGRHYFVWSTGVGWKSTSSTATSDGGAINAITSETAGAHTHNVTGTITIPALTTSSQSTTTSGSTGSGTSFSTQDPYIVTYMYKRTA